MNIEIVADNTEDVIASMKMATKRTLEIMGGKIETTVKKTAPKDTGRLASSYRHKATSTEVKIGTDVEYAPYQEFGTRRMNAQPHLSIACAQHMGEFQRILQNEMKNA